MTAAALGWGDVWEQTRNAMLRSAHLRASLAALAASTVVSGLLVVVLPLYLSARGFTLVQLGAAMGGVVLLAFAAQALSARYSAVLGRPLVVLTLLLVSGAGFPLYALVQTPFHFILASALIAIPAAIASPGLQALLAEAAAAEGAVAVFSFHGVLVSFSYAAGVVLGGLLLAFGYTAVFVAGSLVSLLAFAALARRVIGAAAPRPRAPTGPPEAREAWLAMQAAERAARRSADEAARLARRAQLSLSLPEGTRINVRLGAAHLLVFGLALAAYPVFLPFHFVAEGLPAPWLGVVVAASWVTFGLVQPLGAMLAMRTGRYRAILVGSLLASALLNAVLALGPLPLAITAWVLLGITDGMGRPITSALVMGSVPPTEHGNAFGWTNAASTLARLVGPLLMALLVVWIGFDAALLVMSAVIAFSLVPLLAMRPPAAQPAPPAPAEVPA